MSQFNFFNKSRKIFLANYLEINCCTGIFKHNYVKLLKLIKDFIPMIQLAVLFGFLYPFFE